MRTQLDCAARAIGIIDHVFQIQETNDCFNCTKTFTGGIQMEISGGSHFKFFAKPSHFFLTVTTKKITGNTAPQAL